MLHRHLSDDIASPRPTAVLLPKRQHGFSLSDESLNRPTYIESTAMNTIIYIVGLVVVIGFVLSYFGMR
jgi:hypothetical protein